MEKKLNRTIGNEKMFFGICGGLAKYFALDATLVRIAFVIFAILGFGTPILIYLALMFIMPKEGSV